MIDISLTKLLIWLSISFALIFIIGGTWIYISIWLFGWSEVWILFGIIFVFTNIPVTIFMYFLCPEAFEVD